MMDLLFWPRPLVYPIWARPIIYNYDDDDLTNAKVTLTSKETEEGKKLDVKSWVNKDEFSLSANVKSKEDKEKFKKELIDFISNKIDNLT